MIESEVIREVNHPAWPLVWQIYGESFPRYEQRQSQHQPQKMRDPRYHCQIFYQDGLLLGFIFWWACGEQVYIEHLAINPALRGRNYGSRLLAEFCERAGKTVILEIDPPEDEIAIRRLRFYQGLGFCLNDYAHLHPPYHSDYQGHALRVLSYPRLLEEEAYQRFNSMLVETVMEHGLSCKTGMFIAR
ncbi:GNAT family N-acetyltransferase [Aeromonas veronii]|uniref:GNAT family N-acetyltransferase n=1 Tax=Aeromonas veronii TaxID=654 RepID=UPI00191E9399|nr:GNAT family N-acetyltransferase [Aeromonas veronii]MBL0495468.1 GNAT family N-acetyltransferase [Aeromonas veronii]MCF5845448.1 GNAT family N-acetyltransferase [Aeromonas veronii]